MSVRSLPLAIYHEHPEWFRPLFAELDRRGLPWVRLHAASDWFDPADTTRRFSVFFNRMSPSAWTRGHASGIFYTQHLLAHLERTGARVVNGRQAYLIETSKALQLSLLAGLGLPFPRARVINDPRLAPQAARDLRFPIVVKANIGGSGAGIVRFDTPEALDRAAADGRIALGLDATALVQEYIPPRDGCITRVEVLDGRFLYAIRVAADGRDFNLCPADLCQVDGMAGAGEACVAEAVRQGRRVEAADPPPHVIDAVERIAAAACIEIGGVEYVVDDRDGRLYFYDINALSNFVADAPHVVGFDPFARLVDWLEVLMRAEVPAAPASI
jgi:glutathione synthase/RimK-type ligase-like ATP-grasp enzyme